MPPTAEAPATATPAGPGAAQPTASRLADRLSAPPSDDAAASAPPADQPSGGAGTDDAHGSGGWWRSATHALGTLAAGTARHAAIPLTGLLIMLIFLAVQDNIDRRDPKLALAPLYRERFLRFDGSPEDPGPAGTHHEEEL